MPGYPYRLSSEGLADLIRTEANVPYVYDDDNGKAISSYEAAKGYPTIGIGLRIDTAAEKEMFRPYLGGKAAPAEVLRRAASLRIGEFEDRLNQKLGPSAIMTQSMFDALFSLGWNTGTNSKSVNRVIDYVKAKDYAAAANEIANGPVTSKGKTLPGLVERRAREAALFLRDKFQRIESVVHLDRANDKVLWWLYGGLAVTITALLVRQIRRTGRTFMPAR